MDDLISRKAAIDVAKQHWYKPDIAKALEELPSAQPEERTEERTETHACDCISRQAVYNVLDKIPVRGFKKDGETIHGLISLSQVNSAIINLPSVHLGVDLFPNVSEEYKQGYCDGLRDKPERKKGRWLHPYRSGIACECSVCHVQMPVTDDFNFCPNCGADMRTPVETARDIVHTAIDNSVWSDAVDVSEMHKVVDDKYAEIEDGGPEWAGHLT